MRDWVAESKRIRPGINPIPSGYPFHLRQELKDKHDKLHAEGRRLISEAAQIRAIALGHTG